MEIFPEILHGGDEIKTKQPAGKTPKDVAAEETPLKIKLFHSTHFETGEYNAIWSRTCGP
jgi:hypothetical protein